MKRCFPVQHSRNRNHSVIKLVACHGRGWLGHTQKGWLLLLVTLLPAEISVARSVSPSIYNVKFKSFFKALFWNNHHVDVVSLSMYGLFMLYHFTLYCENKCCVYLGLKIEWRSSSGL